MNIFIILLPLDLPLFERIQSLEVLSFQWCAKFQLIGLFPVHTPYRNPSLS